MPTGVAGLGGPRRLLLFVAVALASRALTLGNPVIYTDEGFYFAAARAIGNGALPFVDLWDRKPVGLFILYLLPASLPLGWGVLAYQLLALAAVVATACVAARLAARAGWARGAVPAALAYILWLPLAGGEGGQAPVFYNLPVALAALLVARPDADRRRRDGLAAMGLVGLAMQVKYTVLFEGVFFALWLLWRDRRGGARAPAILAHAAALAATALLPTAAAAIAYGALGRLPEFAYANFLSILDRNPDPLREQVGNLARMAVVLGPLVAMAIGGRGRAEGGDPSVRAFLFGWLGAAIGGVLVFGGWYAHYALPVMLPAAIAAAGFLGRPDRARTVAATLLLAAFAGQAALVVNRRVRGTPRQFAAVARAVGSGPGCLYVHSGPTMLHPATGRCALSPWVFPGHLTRAREAGAVGVDQPAELRRLLAAGPAVIAIRAPSSGERPDMRAIAQAALARDYRLKAVLPFGRKPVFVHERRVPARPARPAARFD